MENLLDWEEWTVLAVVIIGAINWGLVGSAHFLTDGGNWTLVTLVSGVDGLDIVAIDNLVTLLVGLGGPYELSMAYQVHSTGRRTPGRTETV